MKQRIAFLGVLILLAGALPRAGVNSWTTSGPYGGEVFVLAIDHQTPNVIYAGTFAGGVSKSQNWGQSWTTINQGLGNMEVDSLVIDPSDHNVLYIGQVLGVSKSTDGGLHWFSASNGLYSTSFYGLAISAGNPRILYTAAYNDSGGIFKSTNAGANWTTINEGLATTLITSLAVDPTSPDVVFAGSYDGGMFKTTNGGSVWSPVNNGLSDMAIWSVVINPLNPQIVYAGAHGGGVFKTIDGGGSWQAVNTGLTDTYITGLALDPGAPSTLYAGTQFSLYKSTDAGASWSPASTGLENTWFFNPVVDPRSSNVLYTGSSTNGVYRSQDGGANWVPAVYGMMGTYVHCMALPPDGGGTAFAGCGGHVFKTVDSGRTWQLLSGSANALDLDINPVAPSTMYTCPMYGVVKTTDGGKTWAYASDGLPTDAYVRCLAINPENPQILYAGLSPHSPVPSTIYKSINGGQNWHPTTATGSSYDVMDLLIDPRTPKTVYAAVWSEPGVVKTTDGGTNWQSAGTGLTSLSLYSLAMDPRSSSVLYAATSGGGINKSTNAGQSWAAVNAGLGTLYTARVAVDPDDSSVVYAGTFGGLYSSTNGGANWTLSTPILTSAVVRGLAITASADGPKTVYAGTGGGVFTITLDSAPTLDVYSQMGRSGEVNPRLPSQLLPASPLQFALSNHALDSASSSNPVIIEIRLPEGAVLGQTLADGDLPDLARLPRGKSVSPLAVSEYGFNADTASYEPNESYIGTAAIGPNAVQLFRYVAGEDKIWLRVTESAAGWAATQPGGFLGVTIGVGEGVWPPNDASNWGETGRCQQESTQFYGDLRGYNFTESGDLFFVTIRAFFQKSGMDLDASIVPDIVGLFLREIGLAETGHSDRQVGGMLTDYAMVDLDQDGREDLVSIDGKRRRLYWALQQADGTFGSPQRLVLAGDAPVTVDAADVDGDGLPDILVSDAGGHLSVYPWATLAQKSARPGETLVPMRVAALSGVASASLVADVNQDGNKDFLYTDSAANTLNILYGQSFTAGTSLATGTGPAALSVGDVDGDADLDVAVANRIGSSVTVFRNQGGSFSTTTYAAGGQPAALALADFNRDGRADLALGLPDKYAIAAWTAGASGTFTPAQARSIYFMNPPSAIQADNFDGLFGPDVLVGFADYYKLALCVSDAAGVLRHAFNINTLGDMELDPVNHVTLTEDNIVSVACGTSYGGVCSRAGVAALAQQPFNLVHLPRSANMTFSLVNLGTQTALLNLELYNDTGSLVRSVSRSIAPGQQEAGALTDPDLFGSDAASATRWARAFLTGEQTSGTWVAAGSDGTEHLEGLKLPDPRDARSRFILPGGTNPVRQVLLVNPAKDQAQVQVQRLGGGTAKQTLSYLLPGRGRRVLDLAAVMPALAAEDYLLVSADRPIAGCQLWGDTGKLAALNGLPADETAAPLYGPHVVAGNFGVSYTSTLSLVKASAGSAAVRLDLVDDCGSLQASTTTPLAGLSKLDLDVAGLFGLSGPFTGYVVADPQGAVGVTGCVTFGQAGSLSSLPLARPAADWGLAGNLESGTIGGTVFYTAFFILNPAAEAQQVQLEAHDAAGLALDAKTVTVPGHGRSIMTLDQLMPDLGTVSGGYMVIRNQTSSPSNLLAFALFGEGDFPLRRALRVTYPNGGETLLRGQAYPLTWVSGSCSPTVRIELYKGGAFLRTITGSTANTGSFPWTVPDDQAPGGDYRVRVTELASGTYDESNSDFTISAAIIGNFTIGGYLGVGTDNPVRAVHIAGPNAVFRIDRSQNTSALLMTRTNTSFQAWKTFVLGADAAGSNNGAFVINDLGTAVTGPGANRLTIANDGTATFGGIVQATGFFTPSMRALKTGIKPLDDALDTVMNLQAVRFHWRDTGAPSLGFIAGDTDAAVSEAVSRRVNDGGFGLDYGRLAAPLIAELVEGIKAQQREIAGLRQKREQLKALLEELRKLDKSLPSGRARP